MILRYKKIARNALLVWVISFLVLGIISIPDYPYDQKTIKDIQQVVLLVQGVAALWACGAYAVAKGYSSAVGGLILLFPIGLIILWLLQDKHNDQELGAGAKVETVQRHLDAPKQVLNRNQKAILFLTALFALAALLFPPFVIQHPQSGATYNSGYAFLFSQSGAVVNTGLLALEIVVIAMVGVIGVFLTKND